MNIKSVNCKKFISAVLSVVMFATAFVSGFVFWDKPVQAASNVKNFDELKTACANGGTINITQHIYVTETIYIKKGVTLVCGVDSHSAGSVDLGRHRNFHGNLFRVRDGGTLTVQCCISGRANENQVDSTSDDNGLIIYKKDSSGSYSRITDANVLKTIVNEVISKGYAPVNKTNYGASLIRVEDGGTLVLNSAKSVLKYNYSPYSDNHSKAPYNSSTTDFCTYENGSPEVADNYYLTLDDGSEIRLSYYTLPAEEGDDDMSGYTGVGGGAINSNGTVEIENGTIYGCTSQSGGGITFDNTSASDDIALNITGGRIYKNVSLAAGGGIRFGQGKASIKNTEIYENRTTGGGGGIWLSNNAVFAIEPNATQKVLIRNNFAGNYGGGIGINNDKGILGVTINATGIKTDGVSNVQIKDNIANCRGGGIGSIAVDGVNDKLNLTNVDVTGNKATGEYLAPSSSNIINGIGGGIQIASTTTATLKSCKISGNEAQGGYRDINKTTLMGGRGGGVYNAGGKTATLESCEIFENKVTEKPSASTAFGGGIFTSSDLKVTSTEIHKNTSDSSGGGIGNSGKIEINDVLIYGNTATINGGGVYNSSSGTVSLVKTPVYECSAVNGGAIYNAGKITLEN